MRESRWPPPFTRALKRNLQGSFFVGWWVLGVRCWWSVGRTEAAILYWANWANWVNKAHRAYRANKAYGLIDTANSAQKLIRLIWLMLFIKADVPDMAIGIYFSKSKKKETLIYWAIKFIGFMRLIGIIGLISGIYSLIVFFLKYFIFLFGFLSVKERIIYCSLLSRCRGRQDNHRSSIFAIFYLVVHK